MRKTLFAAGLSLFVGAAAMASQDDQAPEARVYLGFSFGGAQGQQPLHYGLRLDHDRRYAEPNLAPVFQIDLSQSSSSVRMNGLELFRKSYRVAQNEGGEESAEAPAEEAGSEPAEGGETAEGAEAAEEGGWFSGVVGGVGSFFGGIGNFFSNLFGSEEEEEPEASTASGGTGLFANYETIDYVMLGAAAIGLGYLASESLGGDETSDEEAGGGTTGGGTTGGCGLPVCLPLTGGNGAGATGLVSDPEYREWLDGGNGQMGDLGG